MSHLTKIVTFIKNDIYIRTSLKALLYIILFCWALGGLVMALHSLGVYSGVFYGISYILVMLAACIIYAILFALVCYLSFLGWKNFCPLKKLLR